MPYLIDNPEVGYVQARWVFANPDESYLTKVLPTLKHCHACSFCRCQQAKAHRLGCLKLPYLDAAEHLDLWLQAQEISLNFHCKCEQFVHFASGGFFNFNGTAGWPALATDAGLPNAVQLSP